MKEELLKGLSEEQIAKVKACNSAEEILEEYHQRFGARRFIREFVVTDEELSVLSERWNEDEDF